MTRVVPILIVLAIVALMAATAGHPTAPVPTTAHTETGGTHGQGNLLELRGDGLRLRGVSVRQGIPGLSRVSGSGQSRVETPRQKARRIITATWPSSQVNNAMKVVACESGFNQWAANLRDRHSDGSIGSYGLMQIGALWRHDPEVKGDVRRLYLPWTNIRVGLRIYLAANDYWKDGKRVVVPGGSWRPWSCARLLGIA